MKNIALALAIVAGFASAAVATATEVKEEVAAPVATTEVAATDSSKEAAPAATTEVAVEDKAASSEDASKTETN